MGTTPVLAMRSNTVSAPANKNPKLLYLTFDGILEPLGRSQVLRYVRDLNHRGFNYTILSLEREQALYDADEVGRLEKDLAKSSIGWRHLTYRSGSLKLAIGNFVRAFRSARALVREQKIELIHARSYIAAGVAYALRALTGVPYIFDARGYWVDERAVEGRWFTHCAIYSTAKWAERFLMRHAAAVVTLTDVMARDLRETMLRDVDIPIAVIPTCTDYEEFTAARNREADSALPADVLDRLNSKLVVGMVGSVNASYCVDESLMLFQKLLAIRADAHLLCVTQQTELLWQRVTKQGIPATAFTIVKAQHRDMPSWLRQMDWAFLMLHETFAKRGSMPTKLGELLASGVAPIQYGCNQEVREIVGRAGSGIVLDGITQQDLEQAAERIATTPVSFAQTSKAREISREWFDVQSGVAKYEVLLNKVLQRSGNRVNVGVTE